MDMKQLKMVERPISELKGYARNPRKNDDQVDRMVESINEFGFRIPVVAKSDGSVVDGHLRLKAAKKLGMETVPVVLADDLTDAQIKAFRLLANRSANWADWDDDLLRQELADLKGMDFDLSLTGFDADEISSMLDLPLDVGGLTDPDEVPEPPVVPVTKLGDVWLLGKHRLMCGDSTSIDAVDQLISGMVDAIVTDPPYGIGIDGQKHSISKNPKHNRKAHEFRGWDSERPDQGVFNYIVGLNVPAVIWGGNYFADLLPPTRGWIYWSKGQDGLTMSDGELAWTTQSTPLRALTVNRSALQGSLHPTQKPLRVVEFSLEYIKAGNIVLDLFGGSGSTLIACEKTGRAARLMELDPKYCDVIVKRWEDFTGKKAVLETKSAVDSVGHN